MMGGGGGGGVCVSGSISFSVCTSVIVIVITGNRDCNCNCNCNCNRDCNCNSNSNCTSVIVIDGFSVVVASSFSCLGFRVKGSLSYEGKIMNQKHFQQFVRKNLLLRILCSSHH